MVLGLMRRFVGMLETSDGSAVDLDGLLVNAYRSDIFSELQRHTIFRKGRSIPIAVTAALKHYAKFQSIAFGKAPPQIPYHTCVH